MDVVSDQVQRAGAGGIDQLRVRANVPRVDQCSGGRVVEPQRGRAVHAHLRHDSSAAHRQPADHAAGCDRPDERPRGGISHLDVRLRRAVRHERQLREAGGCGGHQRRSRSRSDQRVARCGRPSHTPAGEDHVPADGAVGGVAVVLRRGVEVVAREQGTRPELVSDVAASTTVGSTPEHEMIHRAGRPGPPRRNDRVVGLVVPLTLFLPVDPGCARGEHLGARVGDVDRATTGELSSYPTGVSAHPDGVAPAGGRCLDPPDPATTGDQAPDVGCAEEGVRRGRQGLRRSTRCARSHHRTDHDDSHHHRAYRHVISFSRAIRNRSITAGSGRLRNIIHKLPGSRAKGSRPTPRAYASGHGR